MAASHRCVPGRNRLQQRLEVRRTVSSSRVTGRSERCGHSHHSCRGLTDLHTALVSHEQVGHLQIPGGERSGWSAPSSRRGPEQLQSPGAEPAQGESNLIAQWPLCPTSSRMELPIHTKPRPELLPAVLPVPGQEVKNPPTARGLARSPPSAPSPPFPPRSSCCPHLWMMYFSCRYCSPLRTCRMMHLTCRQRTGALTSASAAPARQTPEVKPLQLLWGRVSHCSAAFQRPCPPRRSSQVGWGTFSLRSVSLPVCSHPKPSLESPRRIL